MDEPAVGGEGFRWELTPADYQEMAGRMPAHALQEACLRQRLGDLRGCSVLDLACGTGYYTRRLKRWGAARTVGVDVSEDTIDYARKEEEAEPLGIEYRVADILRLSGFDTFDRVTAAFVLHLARDRDELIAMLRAAFDLLAPGGVFIASLPDPETAAPTSPDGFLEKYGYEMRPADTPLREFSRIHARLSGGGTVMAYDYFWVPWATYEEAFRAAGFSSWRREPWVVPPELEQRWPPGFWDEYSAALSLAHFIGTSTTPAAHDDIQ